ncbi:OTU domain-containing protein 5-B-like [Amphibalanus amphitrite]|uniref:OTU domain-containing protein 5-B-like n=1 Tax=Amphibalanus amphitrite TaxID=1232801 RepID=UPI001C923577|nr:OTU domain-containing protein 5-B-like [Amphibalanus amphitrite]
MTIKHKKKSAERPLETESTEGPTLLGSHIGHHSHNSVNLTQAANALQMPVARNDLERLFASSASSPPVWPLQPGRSDDTAPQYDEYDGREQPANPAKRRHRASPHRSVRAKHRDRTERGTASPTTFHPASAAAAAAASAPLVVAGPSGSRIETEAASGYNSGDEYGADCWDLTDDQWQEKERQFEKKLKKKGLMIKRTVEDGACLFRAVADQIFGDEEMHLTVRKYCMEYIGSNEDYFSQYITEDFREYIRRKSKPWVHGNHIEIQALSEMYSRTIEVLCYSSEAINIFHAPQEPGGQVNEPIRLSYHRGTHYNSVVNPYKATIGVGLGLPGYVPGLADHNLLTDAAKKSEDLHIEQTMLEDKLKATDWEATNETISEQVARESYLQWLKDNEKRNKTSCASSSTATSADVRSPRPLPARSPPAGQASPSAGASARSGSGRGSPRGAAKLSPLASPRAGGAEGGAGSPAAGPASGAGSAAGATSAAAQERVGSPVAAPGPSRDLGFPLMETASFMNQLPPALFGLSEWEDAGILAQVLAASQQEYLDSLKKSKDENGDRSADGAGPSTSS